MLGHLEFRHPAQLATYSLFVQVARGYNNSGIVIVYKNLFYSDQSF